ncbi:hypothetical protein JW968_05205 [Candidatus Woesearchaeota archaeon]|nr:hypothetical protein [Candidatus Woesearchaeota archaeon]
MKYIKMMYILPTLMILAVGCTETMTDKEPQLPESFTISIFSDGTSSGATREYRAATAFEGEQAVYANRTYFSRGSDGQNHCLQEYDMTDKIWKEPEWEGVYIENLAPGEELRNCNEYSYVDRTAIMDAINTKNIVNTTPYCHNVICYEIREN